MVLAKKRVRVKDLKKQRWAGIVAAVLAFLMVASVVGAYIGQTLGGGGGMFNDGQADPLPEDYLNYFQGEVDRLENQLEQDGPSEAVLRELAESYQYLGMVYQMYFDDHEAAEKTRQRVLTIQEELVDLEPGVPLYRLELVSMYMEQQVDDEKLNEEISALQDILRDAPDPMVHVSLIGRLEMKGRDDLVEEEVAWLHGYLKESIEKDEASSGDIYNLAVLKGEFLGDREEAESMLEELMAEESEDSDIYMQAQNYLSHLRSEDEFEEDIIMD